MPGGSSSSRRSFGVLLAPVVLRIALAVTFIWAGLGKIVATMPIDEGQAAKLASMGVNVAEGSSAAPAAAPASEPGPPPAASTAPGPAHSPIAPTPDERAVRPDAAATARDARDEQSQPASAGQPAAGDPAAASQRKVRRVWGLALRIHESANPGVGGDGAPRMKLWPASIGSGNWPRYFAIAVVVTELGGGVLLAFGLLTRLGALSLAGVMLGAMWLDQIGPAMQAGTTVLWVLPAHDAWDVAAWRPILWQLSLLSAAVAVALLGAGAPSLDRALGWGGRGDDDDP